MPTDDMDWQSSGTPSAFNPYLNSGGQASSLSYLPNHAATPTFPPGASRATPTLSMPASTAVTVSPALLPYLYCGPGHDGQLQTFTLVADTNSSPWTQGLPKSSASFGQSYSTGHRQYSAVQAGVANALDPWRPAASPLLYPSSASVSRSQISTAQMESKREPLKTNQKPGSCFRCKANQSPLWRRDPETKKQLCNACGQRARTEQKKQQKRQREQNAHVGEEAAATSLAGSESAPPSGRVAERDRIRRGGGGDHTTNQSGAG
ncbi:hypothetical protein B0H13DRAFT_2150897 [Mycena leptocephala]|nr:hypothetical protein B0H13DRAFT_2150897 [Mycena leptocephala]